MSKPLITGPEADEETEQAALWYEQQRDGLGQRFLDGVDETLDRLRRYPRAGAPVPHVSTDLAVRRAPVKRFPYHVIYLELVASIHILAVAHDRRRPGYWLGRLAGKP